MYKAELAKLQPDWLEQFRNYVSGKMGLEDLPLSTSFMVYRVPIASHRNRSRLWHRGVERGRTLGVYRVTEVYDQLYDMTRRWREGVAPTAAYKDSLNPADLHVEMVLHESAASAGFERLAKVCEGLRQGTVCHQDRAPRLDRGVPGHFEGCRGACGEHLGWVHAEHQVQGHTSHCMW